MTKRTLATFALLAVACSAMSCGEASDPTPEPPKRMVVIFADVSSSLTPEQVVSVQTHVARIIKALPANSDVHVFSIGRDTESARELRSETAPSVESDATANRLTLWRAELATKLQDDLDQLHRNRKTTEPDTLSSCITTALRRTASVTTRTTRRVDVFIVSDMIEECGTSLLGGQLSLMKRDITQEIKQAREFKGRFPDLRRATFTLVRPQYNVVTTAQAEHPTSADLERFWREVLARCNTDPGQVFFGADLPSAEELFPDGSSTDTATVSASASTTRP